jgi:protocatechuate 3,4-dioxygenase beta subunit
MISRRTLLKLIGASGFAASSLAHLAFAADDGEPRFTPPPGDESDQIKSLIDDASSELANNPAAVSELLCSAKYMPAHEYPRFRKLIERCAPRGQITISSVPEPGDPIEVTCTIVDDRQRPVRDALVYLYHTSAKGWYSDRAPHYSGNAGDASHARLFGYVRSDERGSFTLRTRRPGGYPRSDLPQHIHIEITPPADDQALLPRISEILFEDDDRLSQPAARERAKRERFEIATVEHGADGVQRVRVRFALERKK